MLKRIFLIHKKHRGFTLVEVLVAVAITGIIAAAITTSISQLFSVSIADTNRMEAVKQVENALHYMNRDIQMASAAEIPPANMTPFTTVLNLQWVDYTTSPWLNNSVEYSLDANGNLQRRHTIGTDPPIINRIATHIVPGESSYSFNGEAFTVKLTAEVEGYRSATESRTLEVRPRIK